MVIKIILGAFVISWVGIIYSMITAPLVDENGNIIKEEDKYNMKAHTFKTPENHATDFYYFDNGFD